MESIPISLLSEWDVLYFLYRHGTSLASAEQMAHLVGYGKNAVGGALDALVNVGVVQRSRSSQGIRLYRFADLDAPDKRESLEHLLKLSENRSGRLLIARNLLSRAAREDRRERAGLHLAKVGLTQKEA